MQTLDFVSGLHKCLEFSQPLVFMSGYANTENVFYCLNICPNVYHHNISMAIYFSAIRSEIAFGDFILITTNSESLNESHLNINKQSQKIIETTHSPFVHSN